MRELEVQEILCVNGGEGYPWWSIPFYAGGASALANACVGAYALGYPLSRALATGIQFGVPAFIASLVLVAGVEFASLIISMIPSPSYQNQNVPSCHG